MAVADGDEELFSRNLRNDRGPVPGDAARRRWRALYVAPSSWGRAATGRELWVHEYTPAMAAFASGGGGRPNRGPAISGGTLFLGAIDARLRAIDAFSGTLKWEVVVADPADPSCQGRQCYVITHAPLVVKDKVLVGVGGGDGPNRGFVAAFDIRTGDLRATGNHRWEFRREGAMFTAGVLSTAAGLCLREHQEIR